MDSALMVLAEIGVECAHKEAADVAHASLDGCRVCSVRAHIKSRHASSGGPAFEDAARFSLGVCRVRRAWQARKPAALTPAIRDGQ